MSTTARLDGREQERLGVKFIHLHHFVLQMRRTQQESRCPSVHQAPLPSMAPRQTEALDLPEELLAKLHYPSQSDKHRGS